MGIKGFSDAELIQALRCCGSVRVWCENCPADRFHAPALECADQIKLEAADRLEKLSGRLDSAAGMILRLDDERRRVGG